LPYNDLMWIRCGFAVDKVVDNRPIPKPVSVPPADHLSEGPDHAATRDLEWSGQLRDGDHPGEAL